MYTTIQFDLVADLYDAYVTVDVDIPFFLQEAKQVKGKVLELTAGTGRISVPLAKASIDLTCVDYSEKMLKILREKMAIHGLSVRVVRMDMTQLSLDDLYRLIIIPFNSFSEVVDHGLHGEVLRRIHGHLTEDGWFICTMHNPLIRTKTIDGSEHTLGEYPIEGGGSVRVRTVLEYDATTHIAHGKQMYDVFDEEKHLLGERKLDISFYLFSKHEAEGLFRQSGFEVASLYGNYDRSPFHEATSPFMIWRLKRAKNDSK